MLQSILFSYPLNHQIPNLSLTSTVFPTQVWNSCEAQCCVVWWLLNQNRTYWSCGSVLKYQTKTADKLEYLLQFQTWVGKKCKSDLNWELLDNLKTFYIIRHICTYSSVPNRRACTFINFEEKIPPIWSYFGLHVYLFWEKVPPCTSIPSCMFIGIGMFKISLYSWSRTKYSTALPKQSQSNPKLF